MKDPIRIRGARQHNLKGIDLDLPRRSLTVITGPSGSGKSSLALDTLFAEGQRRYVESLSTYAKQFLERMEKPDVDSVDGISPAVAIEQKNPTKSSRSTVGTATEVYDYMRLLWSRVGRTHCPECGRRVRPDTVSGAVDRVLELGAGARIQVSFPLPRSEEITHELVVSNLLAMGFVRVMIDGDPVDLSGPGAETTEGLGLDVTAADEILVVVDRLKVDPEEADRLADSLGTCFVEGDGEAVVVVADPPEGAPARLLFTEQFRCPDHPDVEFLEPTPQLFSFNNPYGTCPLCTGFGATLDYDEALIVPAPNRSLRAGAIDPWTKPRYKRERAKLLEFAKKRGVSASDPWEDLPDDFRSDVLHGTKGFKGIIPFLVSRERKRYKQYIRVFLRQYQSPNPCRECGGARIRGQALYVRVGDRTIAHVADLPLDGLASWLDELTLSEMEEQIAETILRELRARVSFLVDVGLGYLSLSRQMRTLSGGEAQRINLANSLGSALVDTLYVLDEPTVGLHPRDTGALLDLLGRLRSAGNTVVVVEHDTQAIRVADHVVELGPESGEHGVQVVFEGPPGDLPNQDTATGRYLAGASPLLPPDRPRPLDGPALVLRGATQHNLRGVDVEIPLGVMTVVTGVSGSGKSTLVHDVLYRAAEQELGSGETSAKEHLGEVVGEYQALEGITHLDEVVLVDQSPIGRTPRSNPVTYIKAWDEVRKLFAQTPVARERGYAPGHFSFNVQGGRCEECKGAGSVEVEMIFMADIYVPCDACGGRRYKREVLDVKVKGKTIAEVLELTVDEAIRFFIRQRKLGKTLWQLQQVGLGYLRLGQPATTLSGGESQRLKIARELARAAGKKGRKLYILDEPTTGLSGEDVRKLVEVLGRLVDAGNTVLVIEHNLDVIRVADWVIDLGPGAGSRGGEVVGMGRPEAIAGIPESATGRYLAEALREIASLRAVEAGARTTTNAK
ncbi:MAG: excinuclease ABC subunit UvrA [Gemmatimonadota bacterium]|nr:excinuclease ABC subunit UvrA [Gemmatimonadota bacterium]